MDTAIGGTIFGTGSALLGNRSSKIIHADGELQASEKLAQAAAQLSETPGALHLRTVQTMAEISAEKNSTILFPYEIMKAAREAFGKKAE